MTRHTTKLFKTTYRAAAALFLRVRAARQAQAAGAGFH